MLKALNYKFPLRLSQISNFERDYRNRSLPLLLAHARFGTHVLVS